MDSRFMEMMMSMQRCSDASRVLHEILKNDNRLNSVVVFEPHTGGHCFRVNFSNPIGKVHKISISYPMDIYENKHGYPSTIETALIDAEDNICYVEELGYCDVCRFKTTDEIVEEILRISS